MFILIATHTQASRFRGSHLLHCPNCDQVQPHGHFAISQTDAVWFIEVAETEVDTLSVCEVCGHAIAFPPRQPFVLSRKWKLADGVEALADATGWNGPRPLPDPVSPRTISALVRRIAKSKPHLHLDVMPEVAIFAALGGIAGGALLGFIRAGGRMIFDRIDTFGHAMIGSMLGILAGGLAGATWKVFRRRRRLYRDEILAFQWKLGLTVEQLKTGIQDAQIPDGIVREVIRSLS